MATPPDEFCACARKRPRDPKGDRKTKSAAIVCHCIPAHDIKSWEPLAKDAEYTLVIEDDFMRRGVGGDRELVEVTVEVFDREGELGS